MRLIRIFTLASLLCNTSLSFGQTPDIPQGKDGGFAPQQTKSLTLVYSATERRHDTAVLISIVNQFHTVPSWPIKHDAQSMAERSRVAQAILDLGNMHAPEAIEPLVEKLDFFYAFRHSGSFPSTFDMLPAVHAVKEIGEPALPALIEASASANPASAIPDYGMILIRGILHDGNNEQTRRFYLINANEEDKKALRLRALAMQATELVAVPNKTAAFDQDHGPDSSPLLVPAPLSSAATGDTAPYLDHAQISHLEQRFILQDILTEEKLTAADEAKVRQAIAELGQLHSVEAVPLLADKLDYERQPIPSEKSSDWDVMAAAPKGLLSPAITETATKALTEIGPPALPALIEAVSMRGRTPRFLHNGLNLIVQLAGSPEAAQKLLVDAATEDNKKAQRLRDLAATLPKVN